MTYRIGDTVNVTAGTGTITLTGVNIAGSGTNFDPETPVGTVIHTVTTGQTLVIATRTSDTVATVATAPAVAVSGEAFTITAMTELTALVSGAIDPVGDFNRWVETKTLGNGLERALGRPLATWLWKVFIPVAQRTALKVYCTGKSARVYICTDNDPSAGTFATYLAAMLWPDDDNLYDVDFVLKFRDLVSL
jgi:hypothetical protein